LTDIQRQALQLMADSNTGAIITKFGWTWPEHVRQSEEKAAEVVRVMTSGPLPASAVVHGQGWKLRTEVQS
jgi:hypothetical protein